MVWADLWNLDSCGVTAKTAIFLQISLVTMRSRECLSVYFVVLVYFWQNVFSSHFLFPSCSLIWACGPPGQVLTLISWIEGFCFLKETGYVPLDYRRKYMNPTAILEGNVHGSLKIRWHMSQYPPVWLDFRFKADSTPAGLLDGVDPLRV